MRKSPWWISFFIDDRDENISILEEAAAIKYVQIETERGQQNEPRTQDDIAAVLLAELQDEHDQELANIVSRLGSMVCFIFLTRIPLKFYIHECS